ncbi:unnamed protein product [Toxocara canis]|uniref:PRELI/MSF1 domain-containing protein n=1 Tax=Toxocara canis TaxID=6265 RepID=A0A183VAW3_TOXCA|nr:unnamed protein product [Toxocara canis]
MFRNITLDFLRPKVAVQLSWVKSVQEDQPWLPEARNILKKTAPVAWSGRYSKGHPGFLRWEIFEKAAEAAGGGEYPETSALVA